MKEFMKIQSNGEIEVEAFTLIGASSKRNDSTKIGYFGSGLKYSIASMLRNNIEFKIFQGENEILFDVVNKNFRNENYEAITVNGQETSMTTTMGGKDWDIAFAPIREIYSNAVDEDEMALLDITKQVLGEKGKTTFYIEKNENISHFYDNFELYFCDKNPSVLASNINASIYPATRKGDLRLFRKGILCYHNENTQALFSYNSDFFEINESRVLSNFYGAKCYVARCLKLVSDKNVIKDLINGLKGGNSGFYEHTLDFSWSEQFSKEWLEVCSEYKFIPAEMVMFAKDSDLAGRIILPKSLLLPLFRQFNELDVLGLSEKANGTDYVVDNDPSEILTDKIVDALAILSNTRYKHRLTDIDIKYASFSEDGVLGLAENGKIILSTKLDSEDIPYIAKIIIEENEHNRSGFGDKTRSFQNHLFKLYYDELISNK